VAWIYLEYLICLIESLLRRYEKAVIAMAKQSVTLEVLSYHASASLEDAQRLRVSISFATFLKWFGLLLCKYVYFSNYSISSLTEFKNSVIGAFSIARFQVWRYTHGRQWNADRVPQDVSWFGFCRTFSHRLRCTLSLVIECEEKLSERHVSQLATRL